MYVRIERGREAMLCQSLNMKIAEIMVASSSLRWVGSTEKRDPMPLCSMPASRPTAHQPLHPNCTNDRRCNLGRAPTLYQSDAMTRIGFIYIYIHVY